LARNRRLFQAPVYGAGNSDCCLVPETMTHLADKWYRQKKTNMDSDFTEIRFFRIVLWVEKKITPLYFSSLFTNKRAVLSSAQTD